jgi:hypothetical protein
LKKLTLFQAFRIKIKDNLNKRFPEQSEGNKRSLKNGITVINTLMNNYVYLSCPDKQTTNIKNKTPCFCSTAGMVAWGSFFV